MIGYAMVGTNDLARASAFFAEILSLLGAKTLWQNERMTGFGADMGTPMLLCNTPHDGAPASVGNGVMIALKAPNKEVVHAVHAKALALGAQDEGAPGARGDTGFYGGYFRDLDGNKFAVYIWG
jgi:catechol 2,3-dioxygenase-like lactoylglutathione lyase family enzyme